MKRSSSGLFIGVIIILFGIVFLLANLGKVDAGDLIGTYWPLILILFGFHHLVSMQFRNTGIGLLLIVVGGIFLLSNLNILPFGVWTVLWPTVIILFGLWFIFRPGFQGKSRKVPSVKDDDLGENVLFSGVERKIDSQAFKGGKGSAMFGGLDLDFSNAKLDKGEATIDLNATFGGIDVIVPKEWKVVVDSNVIFGAVENKHKPLPEDKLTATLYIKASTMFGGIEIKN